MLLCVQHVSRESEETMPYEVKEQILACIGMVPRRAPHLTDIWPSARTAYWLRAQRLRCSSVALVGGSCRGSRDVCLAPHSIITFYKMVMPFSPLHTFVPSFVPYLLV